MTKARFKSPLTLGHKGVNAVLIPFDPEDVWRQKPFRLAGRRHGWPVKGTANGKRFHGYIGDRWGRFFIILNEQLVSAAKLSAGDEVSLVIEPTRTRSAYLAALDQSALTTQPKKAREDALPFG